MFAQHTAPTHTGLGTAKGTWQGMRRISQRPLFLPAQGEQAATWYLTPVFAPTDAFVQYI